MRAEIVEVAQGSAEWHALRADKDTASFASIVMAASPYTKRSKALWNAAHGIVEEGNEFIYVKGHAAEDGGRPIMEVKLGVELYPITCVLGRYLASLDGAPMDHSFVWEHKLWSKALAEAIADGTPPEHHLWQLDHQMMVTDTERACLTTSDGTADNMVSCWVARDESRIRRLEEGWEQWHHDLADLMKQTNGDMPQLERAYLAAKTVADDAKVDLDAAKAALIAHAEGMGVESCAGEHVTVSKIVRTGNVNYKKIPELEGIDLDQYRGKSSTYWSVK